MKEKVFIVFVEFRTIDHRFEGGGGMKQKEARNT